MRRLIVVTCLGTRADEVVYSFQLPGGETKKYTEKLAILALIKGLKDNGERLPDKIIAFCTPQAKKKVYDNYLKGELEKLNVKACTKKICPEEHESFSSLIDVMAGDIQEEIEEAEGGKQGSAQAAEVIVDFTHGPRDQQLALMIAVQQLEALGKLSIRDAYYGDITRSSGPPPASQRQSEGQAGQVARGTLVPITEAIEVWRWIEAYRLFRDTGLTHALAELVQGKGKEEMAERLEQLGWCYQGGLVVGLAKTAKEILEPEHKWELEGCLSGMPLGKEVADLICKEISNYSLNSPEELSPAHIKMQLRMLQRLWEEGNYPVALSLLYEIVLSWVILKCAKQGKEKWADGWEREKVKRKIRAIYLGENPPEDMAIEIDEKKVTSLLGPASSIGRDLKLLVKHRNNVAHHGLEFETERKKKWEALYNFWKPKIEKWLKENQSGQR